MHTTKLLIRVVIALLIVREVYVLTKRVPRGTISESVWDWSRRWPVVPFTAGIVAGHLFWQAPSSAGAILGETEKDGK